MPDEEPLWGQPVDNGEDETQNVESDFGDDASDSSNTIVDDIRDRKKINSQAANDAPKSTKQGMATDVGKQTGKQVAQAEKEVIKKGVEAGAASTGGGIPIALATELLSRLPLDEEKIKKIIKWITFSCLALGIALIGIITIALLFLQCYVIPGPLGRSCSSFKPDLTVAEDRTTINAMTELSQGTISQETSLKALADAEKYLNQQDETNQKVIQGKEIAASIRKTIATPTYDIKKVRDQLSQLATALQEISNSRVK